MADVADTHRRRMLAAGMAGASLLLPPLSSVPTLAAEKGFEDAVKQIGRIEQALGFTDLAQFTAPPPPKA
jgi:hypothetical protein